MSISHPSKSPQKSHFKSLTISLAEAAEVIGISRSGAWNLYKKGEFPVEVIQVGARLRVGRAQLEQFLGAKIEERAE